MKNINAVIGAGGHGKVVVSTLAAAGIVTTSLVDDDSSKWGSEILGVPIHGPVNTILKNSIASSFIIGIGDNKKRMELAGRFLDLQWISVVHPRSFVHPSVKIGQGTAVFAGAIIQPDSIIGDHCIINSGALVDHDCVIGNYAHVAPGVHLAGSVKVGEGAFLGVGCSVTPGVSIGSWTKIGAGSVVISDIPPNVVAVGAPAKILGPTPPLPSQ